MSQEFNFDQTTGRFVSEWADPVSGVKTWCEKFPRFRSTNRCDEFPNGEFFRSVSDDDGKKSYILHDYRGVSKVIWFPFKKGGEEMFELRLGFADPGGSLSLSILHDRQGLARFWSLSIESTNISPGEIESQLAKKPLAEKLRDFEDLIEFNGVGVLIGGGLLTLKQKMT